MSKITKYALSDLYDMSSGLSSKKEHGSDATGATGATGAARATVQMKKSSRHTL